MTTTEQAIIFGHLKQADDFDTFLAATSKGVVGPLSAQAMNPLTSGLVGAALGTGGGALKHYLSDRSPEEQKKDPNAATRRMAIGALLGGGAGLGVGAADNALKYLQLHNSSLTPLNTPMFDRNSKVSLPMFGAHYSEGGDNTTGILPLLTSMATGKEMRPQFQNYPW